MCVCVCVKHDCWGDTHAPEDAFKRWFVSWQGHTRCLHGQEAVPVEPEGRRAPPRSSLAQSHCIRDGCPQWGWGGRGQRSASHEASGPAPTVRGVARTLLDLHSGIGTRPEDSSGASALLFAPVLKNIKKGKKKGKSHETKPQEAAAGHRFIRRWSGRLEEAG